LLLRHIPSTATPILSTFTHHGTSPRLVVKIHGLFAVQINNSTLLRDASALRSGLVISRFNMPPACALLGQATPAPHEKQPFCFLNLPREIRDMIYRLLMDRRVLDRVIEIESSEQLVRQHASIENCYYPAMMRVNKQVGNEYTAFVMPRMALNMFWETTHVPDTSTHQILPKKVLSQLKSFDMSIWINHPLSEPDTSSSVAALIQALPCGMPQLSLFSVQVIFLIDNPSEPGAPLETGEIGAWKQTMTASLAALVENDAHLTVTADFDLMCALYSLRPGVAGEDVLVPQTSSAKSLVTFAVCNGPDKDTFELDGLDVKFLGVNGILIRRDNNTHVVLTGKKPLTK
ncbi:hypothetical protein KCU62_g3904, partial [Aureobasidium sp. EXF-3399]